MAAHDDLRRAHVRRRQRHHGDQAAPVDQRHHPLPAGGVLHRPAHRVLGHQADLPVAAAPATATWSCTAARRAGSSAPPRAVLRAARAAATATPAGTSCSTSSTRPLQLAAGTDEHGVAAPHGAQGANPRSGCRSSTSRTASARDPRRAGGRPPRRPPRRGDRARRSLAAPPRGGRPERLGREPPTLPGDTATEPQRTQRACRVLEDAAYPFVHPARVRSWRSGPSTCEVSPQSGAAAPRTAARRRPALARAPAPWLRRRSPATSRTADLRGTERGRDRLERGRSRGAIDSTLATRTTSTAGCPAPPARTWPPTAVRETPGWTRTVMRTRPSWQAARRAPHEPAGVRMPLATPSTRCPPS